MKKILAAMFMAIALSSCSPIQMGGHITGCAPVDLPSNIRGWDYIGYTATISGFGEWYDRQGNLFGYALEEDSTIYKHERCLRGR